jgi:hypothetical protein
MNKEHKFSCLQNEVNFETEDIHIFDYKVVYFGENQSTFRRDVFPPSSV